MTQSNYMIAKITMLGFKYISYIQGSRIAKKMNQCNDYSNFDKDKKFININLSCNMLSIQLLANN